ncbi:MAG: ABC transporter ATP-binding protein [Roseburia sp.]|nr:ABC transporter ATP-binding protein [Roseburia sp.]
MKETILRLEGITKSFGDTKVLRSIDIEIYKGEFITLLGASGCGKTTTLRIISGLEEPDAGTVYLNGEDITDMAPEQRNVNTVFQNYALFPNMNVEKNIAYGLKIKKLPKDEIDKRVKNALEMVQLEGFEKRKPDELSGGQRQRVAIARAVVNQPSVLLLDEPLGALDLKLRRQMQVELKKLQQKLGITFIYITHDQEEAINMSDRIGVMHEGVLEQLGTPNEIYYQPKTSYVADFVGNANIYRTEGKTYAVRSENVLMDGETECILPAVVEDKSFAGGQLKIVFALEDGQKIIASRYGIDSELEVGTKLMIGWKLTSQVEVIDNA